MATVYRARTSPKPHAKAGQAANDSEAFLMSTRLSAGAIALLAAFAIAGLPQLTDRAAAQTAAAKIPRMPDGKPNLQGIWQVRNRAFHNLEDHHARLNMPAGRSVVEGGTIPYQEWALKKREENFAKRTAEDPFNNCYMPGVPRIMYLEFPFQVFQSSTHVAMTFEWTNVHRLIYTNGSKPVQGIEFWMGDSRGRWEGDTLVVDVTNFSENTTFRKSSSTLHLLERYTRVDPETIRVEVTVDDPATWTKPWTLAVTGKKDPAYWQIQEYACHEGNYGMRNMLSASRAEEKAAARKK
jgi:hypothetical protein